jgi:hypothetical protein
VLTDHGLDRPIQEYPGNIAKRLFFEDFNPAWKYRRVLGWQMLSARLAKSRLNRYKSEL